MAKVKTPKPKKEKPVKPRKEKPAKAKKEKALKQPKQPKAKQPRQVKTRYKSDLFTLVLALSFLAMVTTCVFLYLNNAYHTANM